MSAAVETDTTSRLQPVLVTMNTQPASTEFVTASDPINVGQDASITTSGLSTAPFETTSSPILVEGVGCNLEVTSTCDDSPFLFSGTTLFDHTDRLSANNGEWTTTATATVESTNNGYDQLNDEPNDTNWDP